MYFYHNIIFVYKGNNLEKYNYIINNKVNNGKL